MGDGGFMEPALEVAIEKMVEREFKRANKRGISEARVTGNYVALYPLFNDEIKYDCSRGYGYSRCSCQ